VQNHWSPSGTVLEMLRLPPGTRSHRDKPIRPGKLLAHCQGLGAPPLLRGLSHQRRPKVIRKSMADDRRAVSTPESDDVAGTDGFTGPAPFTRQPMA